MSMQCPPVLQTPGLCELADDIRHQFRQRTTDCNAAFESLLDAYLLPICALSPYVARTLSQYPDILPSLARDDHLGKLPERSTTSVDIVTLESELDAHWQEALQSLDASDSKRIEALQLHVLRYFRHRHMVRILWCDLTGESTLEQTLYELSLLAQCCVSAADQWSFDALTPRFGTPIDEAGHPQRLIIIGMGKLGGFELNVSSDIDLIFIYPAAGATNCNQSGHKSIDNGEFFRRVAQRVGKLLNSVTSDGFVYRVDTRLRPFGESGPLVMSLDGLENYYLTQARDWERYAMIKGRALCGNSDDIKALEALIVPFVYKRYLDYNVFESLRELKRKIALSLLQKSMVDNIKLGAGGIREIEFIGQAIQLVRGGRESRLRIRPIMRVLRLAAELDLLSKHVVDGLLSAYKYLRRVENAVQMMRDEQVHSLPDNPDDQLRLICILGEPDWITFRQTLAAHQALVSASFADLFKSQDESDVLDSSTRHAELEKARDIWVALGTPTIDDEAAQALLQSAGFEVNESLLANIRTLTRSSFYQRLAAESQQRVERLVPLILVLVKDTEMPGQTLERMLALVKAVAGRSGYLQVLCDQPEALEHLIKLFSQSSWLAGFVVRQPIVIDELLTRSALHPDENAVFAEMNDCVARWQDNTLDMQMDLLRHFRQAREMRIACAQLDGSLTLMQVSDQLSWLAESIIAGVIALVIKPLQERFGLPTYQADGEIHFSQVGVIAYGKLGGLELGFSSDLDLVLLHDSQGSAQLTDGQKSIDNTVFYARLTQKFVHFMGTNTPAGKLYEIDLRLRPNGTSGVLVSGIDAYANYQQSEAWTWEHQALMRARMVFGDNTLRNRFARLREQVLTTQRPAAELRVEVAVMRERMRLALGNSHKGHMHLKQDAGGIADIEFIVQYLVLAHSHQHPVLLAYTDNVRVLDAVEQLQVLPAEQCQALRTAYLALRDRLHRQALDEAGPVVSLDTGLSALCNAVTTLRVRILGEVQSPESTVQTPDVDFFQ